MKKIKTIFILLVSFVLLITLASCGGSGIKASSISSEITAHRTSIDIKLYFSDIDKLASGDAVPFIREYKVVDGQDDTFIESQTVSFSNSVYTSADVSFTNLSAETTYKYILYITYNKEEEKISTFTGKTLSTESVTISNLEELKAATDTKGDYTLAADIDCGGDTVTLFSSDTFKGTFDGAGHVISNFKLQSTSLSSNGFIGRTSGATIKNLKLSNVSVSYDSRSSTKIGALVGRCENTTIENVSVDGFTLTYKATSTAEINAGGLLGYASNVAISNSYATNVVITASQARSKNTIGGFIGKLEGMAYGTATDMIKNSYAEGTLSVNAYYPSTSVTDGILYVGGFIGDVAAEGLITGCYADFDIDVTKGTNANTRGTYTLGVGGFLGGNSGNCNIDRCVAFSDINVNAGNEYTSQTVKEDTDLTANTYYTVKEAKLTTDTTFDENKTYYTKVTKDSTSTKVDSYVIASVNAGASVTENTYYELTFEENSVYDENEVYYTFNSIATEAAYIAGFAGRLYGTYNGVLNSRVYFKAETSIVSSNQNLYTADIAANKKGTINANGTIASKDDAVYIEFSEAIRNKVAALNNKTIA